MQKELLELIGKNYKKDNQVFFVKDVEIKGTNILVQTDRKSVVIYNTENAVNEFIDSIEIDVAPRKEYASATDVVVQKPVVHSAEVINAISHSEKMSNSLMSVFDSLNESPSEELYKKAKGLIEVANTVVNVQLAQYKLLTLKR